MDVAEGSSAAVVALLARKEAHDLLPLRRDMGGVVVQGST